MVVKHNLTAMNSNRMLGLTTASQAKSTEKLSSGYKINRAADDAAGLAISEKMRKQVRGLTQASSNAQDGISAVQTAEGALNEVQDMLQRMNELAVKSANGTNSESDRSYIQDEINALVKEIDRVSTTTKFNETYELKGDKDLSYDTAKTNLTSTFSGIDFDSDGKWTTSLGDASAKAAGTVTYQSGTAATMKGTASFSVASDNAQSFKVGNDSFYLHTALTANAANFTVYTGSTTDDTVIKKPGDLQPMSKALEKAYAPSASKYGFDNEDDFLKAIKDAISETSNGDVKDVSIKDGVVTIEAFADKNNALEFSLHVGADSYDSNKIDVEIAHLSARGLGVNGLKVDGKTPENATNAIDTIAAALEKVSSQRSALGAIQNRLEHTINNLDNVVENTTSAEAEIRDTDMATEMVRYSNNNILAQAGQSMLAQANQSNQGVLSLLG